MMKKNLYFAIAAAVVLGTAGCGSKEAAAPTQTEASSEAAVESEAAESDAPEQSSEEETKAETEAPQAEHSGYVFQSGDVVMGMNEDVAPVLESLGESLSYAESQSCAFQGLDKIYTYEGFDIYTYPVEDKDYINSIYFTDDTVSTPEGICIGSTEEEMIAAYGEDYTEEFGVYTYTKEKSTLSFIVTDGIIESVEYTAIVEE